MLAIESTFPTLMKLIGAGSALMKEYDATPACTCPPNEFISTVMDVGGAGRVRTIVSSV